MQNLLVINPKTWHTINTKNNDTQSTLERQPHAWDSSLLSKQTKTQNDGKTSDCNRNAMVFYLSYVLIV